MIWIALIVVFVAWAIYTYRREFYSASKQGRLAGKLVSVAVAVSVLIVVLLFAAFTPIVVVQLKNDVGKDIQADSSIMSDPVVDWLERYGVFRYEKVINEGETWAFWQYRVCGKLGCKTSEYPLDIKVEVDNKRYVYATALPKMRSLLETCRSVVFCEFDLRIDGQMVLHVPGTGKVSARVMDLSSQ